MPNIAEDKENILGSASLKKGVPLISHRVGAVKQFAINTVRDSSPLKSMGAIVQPLTERRPMFPSKKENQQP